MSKYYSRKTICRQGHKHDSAKEASRCNDLSLLEKAGEISNLVQQPKFVLMEGFRYEGKTIREIVYRADFMYLEKGATIIEDCKGYKTALYRLKRKLLLNKIKGKDLKFIET